LKKKGERGISTAAGAVLFIILIFALQTTLFLAVYRYNSAVQDAIKTDSERLQEKIVLSALQTDLYEVEIYALLVNNTGAITVRIRAIYIDNQFLCDPSNRSINPTDTYINAKETLWVLIPPGTPYKPWSKITAATERGTKSTDYEWKLKQATGGRPPYEPNRFYLGPLMLDFVKFYYAKIDPQGKLTTEWKPGWRIETGTGAIAWNITVKNIDDRDITINQFSTFTLWANDQPSNRLPWYIEPPPNSLSQRIKSNETVSLIYKWATPKTNSTKLPNTQSIYSTDCRCRTILTFFGIFHEPDGTTKPYGQTIPFEAVLVERLTITVTASRSVLVIGSTMTSTITATVTRNAKPVAGETIIFTTTAGTLSSPSAITDATGKAAVTLSAQAVTTPTDAIVTATWATWTTKTASITVRLVKETITVTASPTVLVVNSTMTSTITAVVKVEGTPFAGANVSFTTTAGTLSTTWAITDSNGIARVNLTAGMYVTTANITAIWINTLGYATVNFVLETVTVTATPTVIVVNSSITSEIRALVMYDGTRVVGANVTFTTDAGNLSSLWAITDANGIAKVYLTAGTTPTLANTTTTWINTQGSTSVRFAVEAVQATASPTTIAVNSTMKSTITAVVKVEGTPFAGANVTFTATAGVLSSPWAVTDGTGTARVYLTAGTYPTTAAVTAKWINTLDTTTVSFVLEATTVTSSPDVIVVNSTIKSAITATVKIDGSPLEGANVTFTTDAGTLSSLWTMTNASGVATVNLTAGTSPTTANVTAKWVNTIGSTTVRFVVETVQVAASPTVIVVNSTAPSTITALVMLEGNPVVGANVTFTTDAGTLSSRWALTNASGIATVNLTAGASPAVANITAAWINPSVSDSTTVQFMVETTQTSASPLVLVLRYTTNSTITAVVTFNGNPVVGVNVTFTTTAGTLSSTWAATNSTGAATVTLSARTWMVPTDAIVTAKWINTPSSTMVRLVAETISVSALPNMLVVNSTVESTITAVVKVEGAPVEGANVTFATDAGTFSSTWAITNASGIARVNLTVGAYPTTPNVTAIWINTKGSATVRFVVETVQVTASPTVIVIQFTMNSTITAVVEVEGNPLAGANVTFTATAGTLSKSWATTDATGTARVTLSARTVATPTIATVTAIWINAPDSAAVQFTAETIQVTASPTMIAVNSDMKSTITANLTVDGTLIEGANVTFTTDAGSLSSSWAITDVNGLARVNLTAGMSPVLANVTAKWVNTEGSTSVLFVLDTVQVSASPTVIVIGSTMNSTMTATVTRNSNPVVGANVTFTTTAGNLSKSWALTDLNGVATVNLTARWWTTPDTTATVTATWVTISGPKSDSTTVLFTIENIQVKAEPTVIATNSTMKSKITAIVTLDGNPVVGANVTFTTNASNLSSSWAITNATGAAWVYLNASMSPTVANVTATWINTLNWTTVRITNLYVTTDKTSYTQTENVTISGLLRDDYGAPIPRVNVTISIVASNGTVVWSVNATTDSDGAYAYDLDLQLIPATPDTYTVEVTYLTYEERYHKFEVTT